MPTIHKLLIGDSTNMFEIDKESVHLMVTSPPYFNAPFDYKDLFKTYNHYLRLLKAFSEEVYRVLQNGRVAVLNIDDMLIDGEKYPIVADAIKIFIDSGFRYRDRITWKKPDGYLRISRRSGVILQNPYPMYFYPDNLLESIIIFQKGKFNYRSISKEVREASKIDTKEFSNKKWYMTIWEINNVLPGSPLEKDIAAFPEEIPYRAIKLFSYHGETVLDPFVGSGTTMKVARNLGRNSIGIEIKKELIPIIKDKTGFGNGQKSLLSDEKDRLEIIYRKDKPSESIS
jgi:modification methylase